jgi:aminoglycoside phosphotransferase family enzyme
LNTREKEGKGKMQVQKQVVEALLSPMAYDEPPGQIELVQTHISYVFLTKKLVYKVKKAVDFGFLDFETLEKRKYYCEKELQLNKRLCGDMYIEVVPINEAKSIKIRGEGKTVEYALKMKRMPQERIMTRLLEENMVYETNDEISQFGSLKVIRTNWDENFDQTQNVVDKTISKKDFELIQNKINLFMSKNSFLINKRIIEGKVRDCHGDIHSGNIFVTDRVYIFDAIEFNERFRYSDVAADVAFLAMDLDFKDRSDLSDFFVNKYVEFSGDQELRKLLSFYKCYRAYVRGKVVGFKLYDPNVGSEEKKKASIEAQTYFKVAASYAKKLDL